LGRAQLLDALAAALPARTTIEVAAIAMGDRSDCKRRCDTTDFGLSAAAVEANATK
jgi:hypothetical protein